MMSFEKRVKAFIDCIENTRDKNGYINIRAAILRAHKKHRLNVADAAGGITSDQEAWFVALSQCNNRI